jgi:O-antigen/teichoic acid export membrane protein
MSLKRSISLNFISQVINLVTGIGTSILLARVLGPEGRGDYILVLTTAGFLVQFFSLGIDSSLTHYVASKKIGLERLLSSVLLFVVGILVAVIVGVLLLSASTITFLTPSQDSAYYIALILLVVFMFLNSFYAAILSGAKVFRTVILISSVTQVLVFLASLFFFLNYRMDKDLAVTILYTTASVYFLMFLCYNYFYFRSIKARPSWNFMTSAELKAFFAYSAISFLCSVFQYLSYRMDFWVVNYYWDAGDLGVYSLGASLSQLLWLLPQSIATIMFPMSSYYDREELRSITERLTRISLFVTFVLVIPLLLLAPYFIPLLFGKEFSDSVFYFQVFLLGIFPFVLIKIFAAVFAGIGKVKYNLSATLAGFFSGAIIYLIAIPRIGLIGGVIGSIVSYVITTAVGLYYYKKEFRSPILNLLLIRKTDFRYLFKQLQQLRLKMKL